MLSLLRRRAPSSPFGRFCWGALSMAGGSALSAGLARLVLRIVTDLCPSALWAVEVLLLKLAIAARGLYRTSGEVEAALRAGDLGAARRLLAWHLVSRPTEDLSAEEVAAAAIESVAENLTDGLVGPLCAWAIAGAPGAWAYRFVQTADSMWGYRGGEYEWLGKPAARLDDLLNWLPARLAAASLLVTAPLIGASPRRAWRAWRSEAHKTASPNAGQTMAVVAGGLEVTLTKRGHYVLEGGPGPATPDQLARARRWICMAGVVAAVTAWRVSAVRSRRR
ncbi:MAG: adenosylcobinamide-phosphate synthase CbiB [Anaerolineae bacterium]